MTDDPLTPSLSEDVRAIYHSMRTVFDAFCIPNDAREVIGELLSRACQLACVKGYAAGFEDGYGEGRADG